MTRLRFGDVPADNYFLDDEELTTVFEAVASNCSTQLIVTSNSSNRTSPDLFIQMRENGVEMSIAMDSDDVKNLLEAIYLASTGKNINDTGRAT